MGGVLYHIRVISVVTRTTEKIQMVPVTRKIGLQFLSFSPTSRNPNARVVHIIVLQ